MTENLSSFAKLNNHFFLRVLCRIMVHISSRTLTIFMKKRQSGALKSFKLFHISTNKLVQVVLLPFVQIRQPTFQLPLGPFIWCWLDLLSSFCWILSCHILMDLHQQFWHSISFNPYRKTHFYGFIYAQVMFSQQFYDVLIIMVLCSNQQQLE
jgi:hypothetical protein